MGGGSDYYQEPVQQQMVIVDEPSKDQLAHDVVDYIGENFGYYWVVILIFCGGIFVFKKKIRKLLLWILKANK